MAATAPRIAGIGEIVDQLRLARAAPDGQQGGAMVLLGAGCSVSAGIPLGRELASDVLCFLAYQMSNQEQIFDDGNNALKYLQDKKFPRLGSCTIDDAYGAAFSHLSPVRQQEFVGKAIQRGMDKINWTHLALGELVKERFIHTILTTNFDQLALKGLSLAGVNPVVADSTESLTRINGRPRYPQLVHLHGSMHSYLLRNSAEDVNGTSNDPNYIAAIRNLVKDATTVILVIGYAGAEEGVMHLLSSAVKEMRVPLYWIAYDPNPDSLSPAARDLLGDPHRALLPGMEADAFFAEVLRQLGIGAPRWLRMPLQEVQARHLQIMPPRDRNTTQLLEELGEGFQRADEFWERDRQQEGQMRLAREDLLAGRGEAAVKRLEDLERGRENDRGYWLLRGKAYTDLGGQLSPRYLEDARKAYHCAADLSNRVDDEDDWAAAHNGLASVYRQLGERNHDADLLQQAIEKFKDVLSVRTPERHPKKWAATQNNLGNAYQALGKLKGDAAILQQAVKAFEQSLLLRTQEARPIQWAMTQSNIGLALTSLGELSGPDDTAALKRALEAFHLALTVRRREVMPRDWAMTRHNMAKAFLALARRGDREALSQALKAVQDALEVRTRGTLDWAESQELLGDVYRELAPQDADAPKLAERAYQEALTVYGQGDACARDRDAVLAKLAPPPPPPPPPVKDAAD